jgi:DNA mismatch endonuclease (patch repair protein)
MFEHRAGFSRHLIPSRRMDTLSQSERSARMGMIRAKDTAPEMVVRSFVHKLGFRYRLHVANLPGRPDLVFASRQKVIFVHGCFWHRHNHCHLARLPKSRPEFWLPKLARNKERDASNRRALTRLGWSSMVIWECELLDPIRVMIKTIVFLES